MVILASKSPRRKELLHQLVSSFEIIIPNIDEYLYPFEELSIQKGRSISLEHPNDYILSADTLVMKNNIVFGKPKDKIEAKKMLEELSGSVHTVKTIYSIICKNNNIEITKIVESKVYFNKLSNELIDKYIESGSPFDKAGGYGIQDKEYNLVNYIEGSYTNVVGLPIEEIKKDFIELKIIA